MCGRIFSQSQRSFCCLLPLQKGDNSAPSPTVKQHRPCRFLSGIQLWIDHESDIWSTLRRDNKQVLQRLFQHSYRWLFQSIINCIKTIYTVNSNGSRPPSQLCGDSTTWSADKKSIWHREHSPPAFRKLLLISNYADISTTQEDAAELRAWLTWLLKLSFKR